MAAATQPSFRRQTNEQTDRRTDGQHHCIKLPHLWWGLYNYQFISWDSPNFFNRAPSSVANSVRLILCQPLFFACFFSFLLAISLRPPSRFRHIFQEDSKWAATEKLSFWFLNSFGVGGRLKFNKVTFASDPASENAPSRQNGFNYEKRNLSDFGRIISLSNAEKRAKICQGTAEIVWFIWCILRSDA